MAKKITDYIFLFDLDSTVTKKEILPMIAERIEKQEEMNRLTESAMLGEIPYKTSFLNRVDILKDINVSVVNKLVEEIPLNEHIAQFITENRERCFIVTGNLDVWISGLMKKLDIENHVCCSEARVVDNKIAGVINVIDKEIVARQFNRPFVVIGDGDNDSGMAKQADIAIGFGGIRKIAPSLIRNIDFAFYDDYRCAEFLKSLL